MYEITTEAGFSAAHHLKDYQGPCENVHGHNWLIKATVRCSVLDRRGIGIDFRVLKGALKAVLARLDHTDLNVSLADPNLNPSSENIARFIHTELAKAVNNRDCRVHRVEVFETPGNSATYTED